MNRVCLIIADGWGEAPPGGGNAISQAKTPNWSYLKRHGSFTTIQAAGEAVGLPTGAPGNSEVGHLNLGTGRIPPLDVRRINQSIKTGEFFQLPAIREAVEEAKRRSGKVHIIGLLSTETIHGNLAHIVALARAVKDFGAPQHFIHLLSDGRDTPPQEGLILANRLKAELAPLGSRILSVVGRYYAMDRDKRWERMMVAYQTIVRGQGKVVPTPEAAFSDAYRQELTDEFLPGYTIGQAVPITGNDSVLIANFRADRVRQLALMLGSPSFKEADRGPNPPLPKIVFMTNYFSSPTDIKAAVLFPPAEFPEVLAEVVSKANVRQVHIAETEKYAHLTYFFNGTHEIPFPLEERQLVQSPKVATYDLAPEMAAAEVGKKAREAIKSGNFGLIIVNFANADMVGHTGNFQKTLIAVESIDRALGEIRVSCEESQTILCFTADHGNAEEMLNFTTFEINPEHTTNPVPFFVSQSGLRLRADGALCNVAATILELIGITKPAVMAESLLIR